MTEDPDSKILIGHVLELLRFHTAANARRGAEMLGIVMLAITFVGLIAAHMMTRNMLGLAAALAASGIVGGGQIVILMQPKAQPFVFGVAVFLVAFSLSMMLIQH